ncbi:Stk1 family PASTA domain-containing Ser/Thr kinase [Faecalimonas sp.]
MMKDGIFIGDRYEVLSKVGAGGMADVYKGKDHKLNRFVAIKILKKEYREDELFVRKFQSEAQAAAGLMHPNIVNVYDVGEESGLYYMVMELVEGITLKDYITKKGVLSPKEVISIAIQVANGIEAAHLHNIVHRDIKPQNIMISKEGKVKVTDFGIAKATSSNTISTNALGSVHYTSPEQARGGFSDFKSDIYSLGITMYEMVTGHLPFDGDTAVSIAIKHLQEEITPPSEYVEDIPFSLEQIILKCTQKSSDRRYQDIASLKEDLKHSLVDPDGDFVVIGPMRVMDETVMFNADDVRKAKRDIPYDEDEFSEDEDFDEYDDFEDDDDYDRKGRKKNDDVNPKMAKMMKILTIVAVVIIAFIVVFIIGKATGLLKFGPSIHLEDDADKNAKVKVPDLRGMTEDEASKVLKNKKYEMKLVVESEEESTTYEKGQIIKQTPGANKEAKKKSVIKVVISSGKKEQTKVIPDVSGKDQREALRILNEVGFTNVRVDTSKFETSSEYQQDEVIRTEPSANSEVALDEEINLIVSLGEDKPEIPNVIGMTQSSAVAALKAKGIEVSVEEDYSDNTEKGKVFYQSKRAGSRVTKGSTIVIRVSKGKKQTEVTVPDIIGKSKTYAKNSLESQQLGYREVYQNSDLPKDTVISCEPGSGKNVVQGTTVTVYISRGPATDNGTGPESAN